ncbi:hypothetical protein F0344_21845 [Streptomyces finlayi]|uniref:Integral membrane protein n=1 Tax=Streptomyces finlayi TaxID=67296 RepID=A0A7G7BNJ0_9ACTN|nr:hypothetical protein [Streptomyces finlayi]QNE76905.1 hypothetical protein F0344_21845 [Streptomyces finlayi]
MHGYGYPPEQPPKSRPSSAALTALRVLFVALTVLSCGFLAWAAMLRLAIVTRKGRDFGLLALVFALNTGLFAFMIAMPEDPEETSDAEALIGVSWMFGVMFAVVAYYLYAEIRHYGPAGPHGSPRPPLPQPRSQPQPQPQGHGQGQYGGYAPRQHTPSPSDRQPPPPGYGYPPTTAPQPAAPPLPPTRTPPPAAPLPTHTPPPAASQRLDQVRAELDELSDYLRKEGEGR